MQFDNSETPNTSEPLVATKTPPSSHNCSNCTKTFYGKRELDNHLAKKMPCDLQCKSCPFKGKSKKEYREHINGHTELSSTANVASEIDTFLDIAGLSEFKTKITEQSIKEIRQLKEQTRAELLKIIGVAQTIPAILSQNTTNDLSVTSAAAPGHAGLSAGLLGPVGAIKEPEAKTTINEDDVELVAFELKQNVLTKKMSKHLNSSDYVIALKCFASTGVFSNTNIKSIATELLVNVHTNPARPELQNIRKPDFSRNKFEVYTKINNETCKWQNYNRSELLACLSKYAAKLLSTTLLDAVSALNYKVCPVEKSVCYCLQHDGVNHILIDDDSFDDPHGIFAVFGYNKPQLDTKIYSGECIDLAQAKDIQDNSYKISQLALLLRDETEQKRKEIALITFTEKDKEVLDFLKATYRSKSKK